VEVVLVLVGLQQEAFFYPATGRLFVEMSDSRTLAV
jgi:hypothetical protein